MKHTRTAKEARARENPDIYMPRATSKTQVANKDDTDADSWAHLSDPRERKRVQNRVAQRNYRKNVKERLEQLERLAAENFRPTDSVAQEIPSTSGRSPYQGAEQQLLHDSWTGSEAHLSRIDRDVEDALALRQAQNSGAGLEVLMGDSSQAWFQSHGAHSTTSLRMPDLDSTTLNDDAFSHDALWLSPPVFEMPLVAGGSSSGSESPNHLLYAVSNVPSKRARISIADSDTTADLEEYSVAGPTPIRSASLLSSRSRASSTHTSHSSRAKGDISGASTPSTSASSPLSSRLAAALGNTRQLGFESVEDLVAQFATADLTERPSLADTQRLARRRQLPRMLSNIREQSSKWSDWEVQGWRDEVTRAAEAVLVDECQKFLSKRGSAPFIAGHTPRSEEFQSLKASFQEDLPNLYSLLNTISASRSHADAAHTEERDSSEVVVQAIYSLLGCT